MGDEVGESNVNLKKEWSHADWMSQLPERLWDKPLCNLAIPGSHDTMTYCLDLTSPLLPSNPLVLKVLDCIIPCIIRPCFYKWSTTQMQGISTQLDIGIRYFDLRIAHKKCDAPDTLYFAHGVYTLLTVKQTLRDIAQWLNSHPKEVVILACSMFEGLDRDMHQDIILFLESLFGSKIFPWTSEDPTTLRTFWKLGCQVIISYSNSAASGHEELWPEIPYWWADQVDPRRVLSYLEKQKQCGRPAGFFVAGLNLTEDAQYIITHPCQSIKTLTLQNYHLLLDWVEKQGNDHKEHLKMDSSTVNDQNSEDWMSSLNQKLWNTPLCNLAIPGSHDAVSYCLDITSPLVRSESNSFRLVDGLFYCLTRPAIYRWATTQERDIVEQLKAGIRYFDLRIASRPQDLSDDLYFTHVIYTSSTVLETLENIAEWLDSHPKEVVILACSHFEGLTENNHETFIFTLKRIFGNKLCPCKGADLTLRGLWASGHQVLLSYDDQAALRHQELWPAIPYWWANQRTAKGVLMYLDWQKELGRPEGFFVSGLNLTAERLYIAMHPSESLRTLTLQNQAYLTDWLRQQHPGARSDSLNIIAGDFVGPVPFCPIVIALNDKLVQPGCTEPVL
ncbi:hypothetical protein AAFF_G00311380 [Aldrovandia affinis]|uniref:Phosphatidylinositol-specific phospholipase C X domain-containing protein n=1 Tax=Aldrovandia affinis TaxID=143900 RepID=A0AAD7R7I8_9TELE|nr:hypothetical protein AAFF_G00311380 [Aldrovandia affinis]